MKSNSFDTNQNVSSSDEEMQNVPFSHSWIEKELQVTDKEVEDFEKEILDEFTENNINMLISECREKVVYNIAVPLGLGKLVSMGLFGQADRLGGNVDTTHNVRQKDENGNPIGTEKFQQKYKEHQENNPYTQQVFDEYHRDPQYKASNKKISEKRKAGEAVDAYSGKTVARNEEMAQDHIIPTKEIHNDPARILAGVDGKELANADSNLVGTLRSLNSAKQDKSMSNFIEKLQAQSETRKARIEELKNKQELTDKEKNELNRLEKQEEADIELMAELDEKARKEYNGKLNKTYYTGKEFQVDLFVTSSKEAVKMGLQQAFGLFLVDLSNACFDELADSYKNGFVQGTNEETFFKACEARLKKVAETVSADWKKLVIAFKDGAISGFISNVITTLINTFLTTAAKAVRIIREGTKILFDAFKTLLFSDPELDFKDRWDAALKIIVTGAVAQSGIILQEVFTKLFANVAFLGNFNTTFATMAAGIITGITTSIVLYGLDKWDPFGSKDVKKRRFLRDKIQEKGQESINYLDEMCQKYGIE